MIAEMPIECNSATLETAMDFLRRGISVIPLSPRDKTPAREWREYQNRRATEDDVHWWFDGSDYNLGIICGEISHGLAVRDFDAPGSYDRWKAEYPVEARRLPTVSTGRCGGRHVYFRIKPGVLSEIRQTKPGKGGISLGDGELRADIGCYVVAPPSTHPNGSVYQWTVPLGEIPVVDPRSIDLLKDRSTPSNVQREQSYRSGFSVLSVQRGEPTEISEPGTREKIMVAIRQTQPTGVGERRLCVFRFARHIVGIAASREDLDWAIREWHRQALPVIGTPEFEETRFDFEEAVENVKFPAENADRILTESLAEADAKPLPECAERYEGDAIRRLIALCAEMQKKHGDSPFFLSCRSAGGLLGIKHTTAALYLRGLVRDRVLTEVERSPRGSLRAIRYKFVGAV